MSAYTIISEPTKLSHFSQNEFEMLFFIFKGIYIYACRLLSNRIMRKQPKFLYKPF